MSILSLPAELLVQIFEQLDVQTAYTCQRVNRHFQTVFQDSVELQYFLECKIAGVDDNPYCALPISMRLQMLRTRESAWSSLTPQFTTSGCVPTTAIPLFDMSGGFFVIGIAGEAPGLGGGVQTCSIPISEDDFSQAEPSWSVVRVKRVVDFAACLAEHDLLAFLVW